MSRRLHERRKDREALLLDLGALVYELHRQGKRAPDLLQRKAAQLSVVDEEVRALEAQLEGEPPAPDPPGVEAELDEALPKGGEPEAYAGDEEQLTAEHALGDEERAESGAAGFEQGDEAPDDDEALAEHEEPRA